MREETCTIAEGNEQSRRKPWHAPKFAVLAEVAEKTESGIGLAADTSNTLTS